jgi:hypothetical protein
MSCAFLCLGQGTARLKAALGQAAAASFLAQAAERVRRQCASLLPNDHPFDMTGAIGVNRAPL